MERRPHLCERARGWASLRADGELSELESALLDGHLDRCASCRSFAQGAENVAAALRSLRLERPSLLAPAHAGHGHRKTVLRTMKIAAAAAVVVATGLVASASGPGARAQTVKPVSMIAGVDSTDRLRELRRPGLVEKGRTLPRNRRLVGEPV
jgi:hypothetical protein